MDSDEALYERMIEGDMGAFDRLYARYERPLFGFLRAHSGGGSEAEDLLNEVFLAILRERDAGRSVRSFRAFIYQVARNLCLNRLRSKKRAGRALHDAAHAQVAAEPVPHAEQQMERCELAQALQRAVERLPQALAELYQLRAAGLSVDELAEVLAIPPGTVKSRTHEMVRLLREEMHR